MGRWAFNLELCSLELSDLLAFGEGLGHVLAIILYRAGL